MYLFNEESVNDTNLKPNKKPKKSQIIKDCILYINKR